MAGRGCLITVQIIGGCTGGSGEVEEMTLPVALHSPLEVLKEQFTQIVGIPHQDQVIILCDLTDPDRNSDRLLNGQEQSSLRECGIRNGSVLTLHALGVSAEQKQRMTQEMKLKRAAAEAEERQIITLDTEITADQANHSYNGIIFDVSSNGPFELEVVSLKVAGMLGRVRIFARDRGWQEDRPSASQSPHWWAHRESVSTTYWRLVADKVCRPSWDKPIEIKFDAPLKLLPHQRRGLYLHSGLPDDLGIQYQSYQRDAIVAQDQFLTVHPGLGHTGSEPFDEHHGWYRAYRSLAGSVRYSAQWKAWSPFEHKIFPVPLRDAVRCLLLCQNQENFFFRQQELAAAASKNQKLIADNSNSSGSSSLPLPMLGGRDTSADTCSTAALSSVRSSSCGSTESASDVVLTIADLPKFVIYNIMEFMHWDWFVDISAGEFDDSSETGANRKRRKTNLRDRLHAIMGGVTSEGTATSSSATAGAAGNNSNGPAAQGLIYQLLHSIGALDGGAVGVHGMDVLEHIFNSHTAADDDDEYDEDGDDDDVDYIDDEEEEEEDDDEDDEDDEDEELQPLVDDEDADIDPLVSAVPAAGCQLAQVMQQDDNDSDDDDNDEDYDEDDDIDEEEEDEDGLPGLIFCDEGEEGEDEGEDADDR